MSISIKFYNPDSINQSANMNIEIGLTQVTEHYVLIVAFIQIHSAFNFGGKN